MGWTRSQPQDAANTEHAGMSGPVVYEERVKINARKKGRERGNGEGGMGEGGGERGGRVLVLI
ncbi:hypothetical protein E2C01_030121 [Portunus trituberculatus]|uniref:Uncharacterized protein n=1 Tax=Portunus trituberculatus TaxID=210409 RepID=A0A5B7EWG7_PORTR|nr:hypothetical protein [Portunus trituberculatus]